MRISLPNSELTPIDVLRMSIDKEAEAAAARAEAAEITRRATLDLDQARDHATEDGGDERYIQAGRRFIYAHGQAIAIKQAALKMDEDAAELASCAMAALAKVLEPQQPFPRGQA